MTKAHGYRIAVVIVKTDKTAATASYAVFVKRMLQFMET